MARGRRFLGQVVLVLAVMAAAFVGARLGLLGTRVAGASHNFNDVPPGAFYHDAVDFLVANGITSGCGAGLFCPENPVTRGQVAVFLDKFNDVVDARTLWAVVESDGTLVRGHGVVSAASIGASQYEVIFNRNVRECAYVATIGSSGVPMLPFQAPGVIQVARRSTNVNGVALQTHSVSGTGTFLRSFHLAVHC